MIGERFGKLVVVRRSRSDNGIIWMCRCDCGVEKEIRTGHLNAGKYTSCGCVHFHGHGGKNRSREYISYHNMVARCHNQGNNRFHDYGGKGIFVCDRWRGNFKQFISDMGKCPDGHQIDRIDNARGYSPDNCRWVDAKTNMRNRSCTYRWSVRGNWYESAKEAGDAFGVSQATIRAWCCGRSAAGRNYKPKSDCFREGRYV